jgi:hypothetical protein
MSATDAKAIAARRALADAGVAAADVNVIFRLL